MTVTSVGLEPEDALRAIRWRCRRGMRELDVMLLAWLDQGWRHSDSDARAAFSRLLQCEDDQLWDWLLGRSMPDDPGLRRIVDAVQSSAIGAS